MRTRNDTYSSQTMRERNSVSTKPSWLKSTKAIFAGMIADKSSLAAALKIKKASVLNQSTLMNIPSLGVINLTTKMGAYSSLRTSVIANRTYDQSGRQTELKERKMKDVLGNISKYAIYAIMSLSVVMGQGTPKLDIRIEDQKVNLSEAEKKDASRIVYIPGDTLRYVITASNIGTGLMKAPEIVDPVPAGVTYVAKSASGVETDITFSMNQGNSYMAWPPYYTVRNSKGILVKREATPEMISHIKWNISKNLNPGDSTIMEFLVVVNK